MIAALLLHALLSGAGSPDALPLPPSLREDTLAACAPTTLEQAEQCLRTALSPADLAIVEDRIPARQFRPGLDQALVRAWRLDDPASPMGRLMQTLIGIDWPDAAASMIISDLQVRSYDPRGLDFEIIRRHFRENPRPPEDPVQRKDGGEDSDAD
ncbi:MAG TPA: hypothetical protein VF603_06715 [Allosphingosinicella sp.]|jgi:hypothetical protein